MICFSQIKKSQALFKCIKKHVSKSSGLNSVKVILDGGQYVTMPTIDGQFALHDIPVGAHLLQVVHPVLRFDLVRIEVEDANSSAKLSAYLADLEHGRGAKLKYPLGLAPSDTYVYLEKRESFDILSIFKSPMALMGVFSFAHV